MKNLLRFLLLGLLLDGLACFRFRLWLGLLQNALVQLGLQRLANIGGFSWCYVELQNLELALVFSKISVQSYGYSYIAPTLSLPSFIQAVFQRLDLFDTNDILLNDVTGYDEENC